MDEKAITVICKKTSSDLVEKVMDLFYDKYMKEYQFWNENRWKDDDFSLKFYEFEDYWRKIVYGLGCRLDQKSGIKASEFGFSNPDEGNPDVFLVMNTDIALKIAVLGEIP